jgi:beta-fructofuranosidase
MPEGGWMNDPNGLIQYKGKYHVFFQSTPDNPRGGLKYWSHVVSDDLVRWQYLPDALSPDMREKSIYSGSAVDNNGELTLMYTVDDNTKSPKEVQCIAVSSDGIHFEKYAKNPVIPGPPPGFEEDFRDPKVFRHDGVWYVVVGCSRNNTGGILLYASKDLRTWDYRGIACQSNGKQGVMWECPDLFELDGTWVLVTSPMKMENSKCIFITGVMDFSANTFKQHEYRDIDYGHEFYAPQTFRDDKGRRILIGWMDMWGSSYPTEKNGWVGALTFPRELFLYDGEIWQKPVEEIRLLRKKTLYQGSLELRDGQANSIPDVRGDCLEIAFTLPVPQNHAGVFTMYLRASENRAEKAVFSYDFASGIFTMDKQQSGAGDAKIIQIPHVSGGEAIPVHILIDRSSIEFFLCGGKYAVSNRIYPEPSSICYDMFIRGSDITISDLSVFELSS